MAELSPTDRLVRKRNSNLQKQLHVTLQILSEEYRQTKERMYKEERDCGKFLQSLYSTVPGLHTYGQPDTRAMNKNSMLKERRYSVSISVVDDSDSEDMQGVFDSPFKRQETRPWGNRCESPGPKATRPEVKGKSGGGKVSSPRSKIPSRGSSAKSRAGEATKTRPSTAGARRISSAHSSMRYGDQNKPSSSNSLHRPSTPKYGKSAYTDHDRSVQDKVLKKFQVIFDPDTEARKINLSTTATPIVVLDQENHCTNNLKNDSTSSMNHHKHNVIHVNGQEFHLNRMPPTSRRVMWSAHSNGNQGVVSAPCSARPDKHSSEIHSSKLHSSSLSSMKGRPMSAAVTSASTLSSNPGYLDPKIQLLALQRSLPAHCTSPDQRCDSPAFSETDAPAGNKVQPDRHPKTPREEPGKPKVSIPAKKQPTVQNNVHHVQSNTKSDPSHQLKVPGSHHDGDQPGNKHPPEAHSPSRKNSTLRPSSRASDVSDRTPPVELWSRLMKAGLGNARKPKRPMTAPSKSELSHRSMPAPRQTVVGILAQIENQKANTRAMLNTSKELQRAVKKLVPWAVSMEDLDD